MHSRCNHDLIWVSAFDKHSFLAYTGFRLFIIKLLLLGDAPEYLCNAIQSIYVLWIGCNSDQHNAIEWYIPYTMTKLFLVRQLPLSLCFCWVPWRRSKQAFYITLRFWTVSMDTRKQQTPYQYPHTSLCTFSCLTIYADQFDNLWIAIEDILDLIDWHSWLTVRHGWLAIQHNWLTP